MFFVKLLRFLTFDYIYVCYVTIKIFHHDITCPLCFVLTFVFLSQPLSFRFSSHFFYFSLHFYISFQRITLFIESPTSVGLHISCVCVHWVMNLKAKLNITLYFIKLSSFDLASNGNIAMRNLLVIEERCNKNANSFLQKTQKQIQYKNF